MLVAYTQDECNADTVGGIGWGGVLFQMRVSDTVNEFFNTLDLFSSTGLLT